MRLFVTMWNTHENKYSTLAKIAERKFQKMTKIPNGL